MDGNVYRYGAGNHPPLLVGRDTLVRDWVLRLNEVEADGRAVTEDVLLTGPRGVGKTCAVTVLTERARDRGFDVINLHRRKPPSSSAVTVPGTLGIAAWATAYRGHLGGVVVP